MEGGRSADLRQSLSSRLQLQAVRPKLEATRRVTERLIVHSFINIFMGFWYQH